MSQAYNIRQLSLKHNVCVVLFGSQLLNIFNAQTKTINDKLYGSMMLGVSKDEDINRVYKYLSNLEDVTAEIINKDKVLSQLIKDKEEE